VQFLLFLITLLSRRICDEHIAIRNDLAHVLNNFSYHLRHPIYVIFQQLNPFLKFLLSFGFFFKFWFFFIYFFEESVKIKQSSFLFLLENWQNFVFYKNLRNHRLNFVWAETSSFQFYSINFVSKTFVGWDIPKKYFADHMSVECTLPPKHIEVEWKKKNIILFILLFGIEQRFLFSCFPFFDLLHRNFNKQRWRFTKITYVKICVCFD
jgi:hypothetical protein